MWTTLQKTASVGCSPANWLSQTRRNLTIEFLNLNFASRKKLCKNLAIYEKINTVAFILCGKVLISCVLAHPCFTNTYHFLYDISVLRYRENSCGKILDGKFSNAKNMMLCVSKLRKLLVSLDIGQLNALVIFPIKRSIFSETSK